MMSTLRSQSATPTVSSCQWEILTGNVPWLANARTGVPYTHAGLMRAVCNGERPPLPSDPDRLPIKTLLRSLMELGE